jgi:hypothetical protein
MSHSHGHSHDHSAYYMEQLCTIAVCGLLGMVAVLLYYQGSLRFMLAHFLHSYVWWSGLALIGLTIARAVSLWSSSGQHHCHAHEQHWRPWRYIVLFLPIVLFILGLPNQGFSSAKAVEVEETERTIADQSGDLLHLDFLELQRWAFDEGKREWAEGRTGDLRDQFAPSKSSQAFGLVRYKMLSCPCDAIPIHVAVISPDGVPNLKPGSWVQVTGQIQFRKRKDRDEYLPALKLRSRNDVIPIPPDSDPFLQ